MSAAVSATKFIAANPPEGDILLKVLKIYEAWKAKRSLSDFHTTGTLYLDMPSDDFPDDQTEPRRIPPSPQSKRPQPPPSDGDGSRKAKRVKPGGSKDSPWLDDVTLSELEPDRSPQEAWQEKAAWIQTWVG